jgi:hypothetical protein
VDHVLETFQTFLKRAQMAAKDQVTHLILRDENMFGDNNNNDYVKKKKQKDTDARGVVLKQPDTNESFRRTTRKKQQSVDNDDDKCRMLKDMMIRIDVQQNVNRNNMPVPGKGNKGTAYNAIIKLKNHDNNSPKMYCAAALILRLLTK